MGKKSKKFLMRDIVTEDKKGFLITSPSDGELLRLVPSNDGKYILVSHEVDLVEEPEVTEDSSNFFGTFWNGVQNQNDEE